MFTGVQIGCQIFNFLLSISHALKITLYMTCSISPFQQYQDFSLTLNSMQTNGEPNKWVFTWGFNMFSSRRVYKHLVGHGQIHPVYRWLWKSACQNKRKIFFWLLLKDRLSRREIHRRKNMHLQNYTCVLC